MSSQSARPCCARPTDEPAQQGGVGALRVLRLPALVAQMLQKVFDQRLHA